MDSWIKIMSQNDFTVDKKLVIVNRKQIALFRTAEGIFALDNTCSHAQGALSEGMVDGFTVQCPEHGARFDIRNGKNLSFPAVVPVKSYPAKIEHGNIFLQLTE
jgi:nitrite reductase/ring-hydroxylating ferredoxin subunit